MVSIKDVAALAGVSTATVSRALSNPDKVSQATRDKVMSAVKSTGYRLNTAARQFRTQRTDTVLVLLPDLGNPFFSNIIQGIESAALERGYRVVLGETNPDLSQSASYAGYMQQRHADGAILLSVEGAQHFLDTASDMPAVMACEHLPNSAFPTVRINNVAAAEEAIHYLLKLGHKKIAYINGPAGSPISKDRLRGFRKALQSKKIKANPDWILSGDYSPRAGYEAALSLLDGNDRPSAIFTCSDAMAIGAMRAAAELGLSIPGDVSLVGFDDIRFAQFMTPTLTTIHQPREAIGETAMQMLATLLAGEKTPMEIILEHELVERESTAKPN